MKDELIRVPPLEVRSPFLARRGAGHGFGRPLIFQKIHLPELAPHRANR